MKPLKRFFLYCFYCTIAYFTKGHPAHGAYKTWTTISQADSIGNHLCKVYTTSDNTECTEFSIGEDNSEFEGSFSSACETGISHIEYSKAVLCKTVEKNEDGKCTLTDCSWDCELSCAVNYWGKTILYTEIDDVCPPADEAGPACPENKKYSSTSWKSWCNECPTTWSDDGEHSAGTCRGGDYFECDDYPSLGEFYTPNKKENTCDRMCWGGGLYYDYLDQGRCLQCPSPMKECIGKYDSETSKTTVYATECNDRYYLDDGNCKDCPENSKTCDANGALSCDSSYYLVDRECVKCPDNATCYDNGTYVCYGGYYKYNGGCEPCPEHHETCTNDGFTCQDGYFSNGTACPACETAFENAITCTAVAATSCHAGYYLSAGQCAACPTNSTCTSDTNFTCNNGFYKSNGACVTCPTNHKTCNNDGFTCKDGYYRSGDKCERCQGVGVATCTANGATSCKEKYFLNNGQCLDCPENATCDSDGFTCKDGYFKNDAGCRSCPEYADCTNGVFNGCWTGITGLIAGSTSTDSSGASGYSAYYGDENGCYPCPDNALCYAGRATGICQTGFYGVISGTGAVCTRCPRIGGTKYGDTNASSGAKTAAECFANVGKAYMYEDNYGQFYYASANALSSGFSGTGTGTGTGTGSSDSSGYYTEGVCFYGGI